MYRRNSKSCNNKRLFFSTWKISRTLSTSLSLSPFPSSFLNAVGLYNVQRTKEKLGRLWKSLILGKSTELEFILESQECYRCCCFCKCSGTDKRVRIRRMWKKQAKSEKKSNKTNQPLQYPFLTFLTHLYVFINMMKYMYIYMLHIYLHICLEGMKT